MDVEKLLAAIEEAGRLALSASPGPWRTNAEHDEVYAVDDIPVCEAFALSGNQLRATATFIAHNDPAAVLRRCRLDRETVQDYQRALGRPEYSPGAGDVLFALRMVVTRLALAYGISVEEETTGE